VAYVNKKEAAKECSSSLKGVYNYEEGGKMKEMERSVASNIGKDVEVETKHTEGQTSTARSSYTVLCELHVNLPWFMCEMSGSLNILLQMCFRLGWVMWNGLEECWKQVRMQTRTWLQLLSCTLITHCILIWKAETDREKR